MQDNIDEHTEAKRLREWEIGGSDSMSCLAGGTGTNSAEPISTANTGLVRG